MTSAEEGGVYEGRVAATTGLLCRLRRQVPIHAFDVLGEPVGVTGPPFVCGKPDPFFGFLHARACLNLLAHGYAERFEVFSKLPSMIFLADPSMPGHQRIEV